MRSVVWFRDRDLRVADHAPLAEAAAAGDVIPLLVLEPGGLAGPTSRARFQLEAISDLYAGIAELGSSLVVVEGDPVEVVPALATRWRADRVLAQRSIEPAVAERDARVAAAGVRLELQDGETLVPPGRVLTRSGTRFGVFTPFARAFLRDADVPSPLPQPRRLPPLPNDVARQVADDVARDMVVHREATATDRATLEGGERAARSRLSTFVRNRLDDYAEARDRLGKDGTSRLSADLRFGTISARAIWKALAGASGPGATAFRRQLVWREFTYDVLDARPTLLAAPYRTEFEGFPWADPAEGWQAWIDGATGYPIVDAAARQLLTEGYVHNRARMISASFLTKHLRQDYRLGEAHYMRHLVDGDPPQNNFGWQWSAGSGFDAQPWFRIFNPVRQGVRFDPDGAYVKRWLPELAGLPARWIHRPWEAPDPALGEAGVRLNETYPMPIVDLHEARERYLAVARPHLARARDEASSGKRDR